jgi:hypothetical protein
MKMGQIGCSETSVSNYLSKLSNTAEQRRSNYQTGAGTHQQHFEKLKKKITVKMNACLQKGGVNFRLLP